MALTLTLDPAGRLMLEPGYRHEFSAAELAQIALPNDPAAAHSLWTPPGTGVVMLKPLQLQPDFLNHQAQLDQGCVQRLNTDLIPNAADLVNPDIEEISVGSAANPWIAHTPATTALPAPTHTPTGWTGAPYSLQGIFDQSESGSSRVFVNPIVAPVPGDLIPLVDSLFNYPQNQGWLFRWHQPAPGLGIHQTVHGFVFAQYCAICRGALLEVYEDVSVAGDRSDWQLRYKGSLFNPGAAVWTPINPIWPFGQQNAEDPLATDASLMVMPFGRQRVLFLANTGSYLIATARGHPRRTMDGFEWDILRSDSVRVYCLSPQFGRFQVQKLKFEPGPATLNLPPVLMEYTPVDNPAVLLKADHDSDSAISEALQFPILYTFPSSPMSDETPPPTTQASAVSRSYGVALTFAASSNGKISPQAYSVELFLDAVFMDNPATPTVVGDTAPAARVTNVEFSLGTLPGEGRMTAHVEDVHPQALTAYQFRSEMPVQLASGGATLFTGYTDKIEVRPRRLDTAAPTEMIFRATDRWLLLESTFLREQRDWTTEGHIDVVDTIARQCGIDTGTPPGALAEYPAGYHDGGALEAAYNQPLGTPIQTKDNLEGNQLLGWKPQPHDTGASFLRRIVELFSNWLIGFRADGTFFYLPYDYFKTSSVTFHPHQGRQVNSGLTPDLGLSVGLGLFVHGGTATINGAVTASDQAPTLTDNAVNTLYLNAAGTVVTNTTGIPPANTVTLGTATTAGGSITSSDITAASGRQVAGSPIYREPVEYRTIEPSGNVVQAITHYQLDLTANRSGLYVDWASIKNPAAVNYLGRMKWFIIEIGGAFSPSQLNWMAYQSFQSARRRRLRVSFDATYVPTLKIGQVLTLEGIAGTWRLLEMRVNNLRAAWQVANYVAEKVEKGHGLP